MAKFTLKQLSERAKVASRAKKAYKMPSGLRKSYSKQKTLYFKGPKGFQYGEGSEAAFVKTVKKAQEKFGKKHVAIAHQNNPSNSTSAFVERMSKKHGFTLDPPQPVENFGKTDGYKVREKHIQKAVDNNRIIPLSFDKDGRIGAGKKNQGLFDKVRMQHLKITKETVTNSKGKQVSKFRKSKVGKNTQQNTALQAIIDERQDVKTNPAEVQATDEFLTEKQNYIKSKGNESGKINAHYAVEDGIAPEEGTTVRKEIDDYNESAKPRKKVIVNKPRIPFSHDVGYGPTNRRKTFAETPGKGKPQIIKLPDLADTSTDRRFIENFDEVIDHVASLAKGKKQGEALINYSQEDTTNKKNVPKDAVNKGTLLTNTKTAPKSTRLNSNVLESEFTQSEKPENVRVKSIKEFTDTSMDVNSSSDKTKSGSGMGTHKKSHLEQIEFEDKQDLKNLEKHIKKIRNNSSVRTNVHSRKRKDATLISEVPDSIAFEAVGDKPGEGVKLTKNARSKTSFDTTLKDVPLPKTNRADKVNKVKAEVANIDDTQKYAKKMHGQQITKSKGFTKGRLGSWAGKANWVGGVVLGGIISSLFSKSTLKAKGIDKPSSKQLAHQAAADYIGSPRVLGGVGEKKGYLQKVGLTKKGVSGKRRASGPIKGAGGDSTPYAAITRFFSSSKKNAFNKRPRN
tara:strand:+ start:40 stop:2079 length:2040 start_codon:yes stop_codon:yes gene_type:complete